MRVLWISHDPVRSHISDNVSSSGFWKEALLTHLSTHSHYQIFVASPGKQLQRSEHHYFSFRFPNHLRYHDLPKKTIADLLWIIQCCRPQLIHIHGTEQPYGIIKSYTTVPVVISLQGFLSVCYPHITGGILSTVWSQFITIKEHFRKTTFPDLSEVWKFNALIEQKQIRLNNHFIGRTKFDHDFVKEINPAASYYQGNELLRSSFYFHKWQISKIRRYRIYTSSFTNPLKGFHVLLNALPYLIKTYPEIEIVVPGQLTPRMIHPVWGNGYYRMIANIIHKHNLYENISFKGRLSDTDICQILCSANVFVLSSFMENSSNALGEAQRIGVPCIVAPTGGTTSLIENGKNGLFFEPGNDQSLADQLAVLFQDDHLANQLSAAALEFAASFYNPDLIQQQYTSIYSKIISLENSVQRQ
ncbi:MAG: glycosyltransferase [Bacteroidetes bacterium]|nr:glycosyltransferase [Bacteroidota bacterium]